MKSLLLTLVAVLVSGLPLRAFPESELRRIDMQDGLADHSVYSIQKDRDGFLWFGTGYGLSRWDGKTVRNFTPESPVSVFRMYDTSQGLLLFIANHRLRSFDRQRERFVPVTDQRSKTQFTDELCPVNDTLYWSVRKNRLQLLERSVTRDNEGGIAGLTLRLKKSYALTGHQEHLNHLCLSPDRNTVYLTTDQCRFLAFDCRKERIETDKRFQYREGYPVVATSLICDDGNVWITFLGRGIIRYNIAGNDYEPYANPVDRKTILSHNDVYGIVPIDDRRLLAVTWDGYTIFTPARGGTYTTKIYDIAQEPQGLESHMISAYYDPQGGAYLGTHGGGVVISPLRAPFYRKFQQNQSDEICGIVSDDQKHIYLATYSGEILRSRHPFRIGEEIGFEPLRKTGSSGKSAVLCTLKDPSGDLWFGNSNASISRYDTGKRRFTEYPLPADVQDMTSSRQSVYVWALLIDREGRFWVGTSGGLLLFDRRTGLFSRPELAPRGRNIDLIVRALAQGGGKSDNVIYLGTVNGLYKLESTGKGAQGTFRVRNDYESRSGIPARYIRSLLCSADGQLYIGYTMGLGILAGDSIRRFYTTSDGLCSNFIDCMTQDSRGNIWLGTNSGISCYSSSPELFFNYYISGSNKSAARIGNTLFWSSHRTLTWFDPRDITTASDPQAPQLLNLEINNRCVEVGESVHGQVILKQGLPWVKTVALKWENRDFSLRFGNPAIASGTREYQYRLIPYQEKWLVCDASGEVSYTNLSTGRYTFEVKSLYPEGRDSAVRRLHITILPHWSQSGWMKLCLCLLLIALAGVCIGRFRKKQKRLRYEASLKYELAILNLERNHEKQLREEKEHFFTNAAHELRTPLTLVLSPLMGLLAEKSPSDPDYPVLTTMLRHGNALRSLADDLLCIQKIEAGMLKLSLSEADVVAVAREVFDAFRPLAESQETDFSMESESETLPLRIDVEKIASAIRNLLSNAFKYTPKKGKIRLLVSETETDGTGFCRISVEDNGTGIPRQLQERLFDPFATGGTDPAFSTKIGIGLYIVKHTLELHHGRVSLTSEPGRGSTFTLSLPKGHEHRTESPCQMAPALSGEPSLTRQAGGEEMRRTTKRYTLLIVEDNPDIRHYLAGLFPAPHYALLEAANGQEGVEKAKQHLPDLIISDILMPVKDGFECCREIRRERETAHIPIIMLTARVEDTDRIESIRQGADDYLMKPFNPELLKAKVEHLLLRREQLKRLYTKSLLLRKTSQAEESGCNDDFMQQVINIIEANLTNDSFGVKVLAGKLNLSQPTLYRKIKQRSELSIIEVIRSVRMSKAASLLLEHRYSILEVSLMVGFLDPNTFRKHFTEQFGVPPSKYV